MVDFLKIPPFQVHAGAALAIQKLEGQMYKGG